MNGGGKTELRSDSARVGYLIGHAGRVVRLSVKGPPGVTIARATYGNTSLPISADGQQLSFQIALGGATLGVELQGRVVPGIHSLVEEENELARFQGEFLTLTIRGE